MKKIVLIILAVIILGVVVLFIRGEEDTWLCDAEKGEWVKHGVPSAPTPTEQCGEMVCEKYDTETCLEECVVCPPCAECSSISCQTEEFCESIGFDRDWYENIRLPRGNNIECAEDQRDVDACIELYQPVCATVNIQCITTPCDPIEETYANSCKACSNSLVSSYAEGECK